ncbi:Per1 protein [Starmerella bacillaris]|uniref:Post-GPI attachment to proteins factor 3 n=1 Tax=Starmerella bacillaris TaxID=1247836 RepID=A0AAV5RMY5_STABA|nr:Per1 protein [Starmerella bacillaris]
MNPKRNLKGPESTTPGGEKALFRNYTTMLASIIVLAPLIAFVAASAGDADLSFMYCVRDCIKANEYPPGILKLLLWDLESNCDYHCQQTLTDLTEASGERMQQFHGKWPFRRVMGVQEPAAVFFSMMNFWPHFANYRVFRNMHNPQGMYMKKYYLGAMFVGMNTWLWSTLFHTRDLLLTERMDYFSALFYLFYALLLVTTRLFRLDLPSKRRIRYLVHTSILSLYFIHIFYLSFIDFNYKLNMMVGVIVGLSQTLLWITLGIKLFRQTRDPAELILIISPLLATLGLLFELNDFPPLMRLLDAHSLWHASTVIPSALFYKWVKLDMLRPNKDKI